ncbi:MAG UNVERIFIED_CONTAM: hypothetical protein LVR18_46070 [Planctomycetaceae bacterium]|jgi:hypothetical protein
MTALGRCTLLAAVAGLLTGLTRSQLALASFSLTIVLWILIEWLWFAWRVQWELPQLRLVRHVGGSSEAVGVVQAGRLLQVAVHATMDRGQLHGILRLHDWRSGKHGGDRQCSPCSDPHRADSWRISIHGPRAWRWKAATARISDCC